MLVHLWTDQRICVLSLPGRFVADPASLARDNIVFIYLFYGRVSPVEYLSEKVANVKYDGTVYYIPMVNLQSRCRIWNPKAEEHICQLLVRYAILYNLNNPCEYSVCCADLKSRSANRWF